MFKGMECGQDYQLSLKICPLPPCRWGGYVKFHLMRYAQKQRTKFHTHVSLNGGDMFFLFPPTHCLECGCDEELPRTLQTENTLAMVGL